MKTQMKDGKLGFHPYFDILHNKNGKGVSSMHWLLLYPKEIPWFSCLIEAKWTPALVNEKRSENPYQESNLEPPVLWHSASSQLQHCLATTNYEVSPNSISSASCYVC